MQLIESSLKLRNLLQLEGSPVAVSYCDQLMKDSYRTEGQIICQSLQDARFGKEMAVCLENSKCSGGSYFLGFVEKKADSFKFWSEVEKSFANRCVTMSHIQKSPAPPTFLAKYVALEPVEKCTGLPDLISFICTAEQAARLLGLHAFQNGATASIYSYAAACAAAIGIPMATGKLHVSFIDNSARKIAEFAQGELIVTIPAVQVDAAASSIEHCIWGTATTPFTAIEERLRGNWVLKKNQIQPQRVS